MPSRRLPARVAAALHECKSLGVRAGARSTHRFIAIWVVVVGGRAFARSWTAKPDGWHRAFRADPAGAIRIGTRTVRVRAVPARGVRLWRAIEQAYAEKYPTPGSRLYVRGFRTPRRRATTVEFVPR